MLVYSVLLRVCVVSITVNSCNLTRLPCSWCVMCVSIIISTLSVQHVCLSFGSPLCCWTRLVIGLLVALLLAFGGLPLLLELFCLWGKRESSGAVFPRACVMSGELVMALWGLSFSEQKAICQHGIREGYFSHSRDRGGETEWQRKRAIQRCLFSQSLACSNPAWPQRQGIV